MRPPLLPQRPIQTPVLNRLGDVLDADRQGAVGPPRGAKYVGLTGLRILLGMYQETYETYCKELDVRTEACLLRLRDELPARLRNP